MDILILPTNVSAASAIHPKKMLTDNKHRKPITYYQAHSNSFGSPLATMQRYFTLNGVAFLIHWYNGVPRVKVLLWPGAALCRWRKRNPMFPSYDQLLHHFMCVVYEYVCKVDCRMRLSFYGTDIHTYGKLSCLMIGFPRMQSLFCILREVFF